MSDFWYSIASYNIATWWVQIIWLSLAALAVAGLCRHDTAGIRFGVRLFMAISALWLAIVYFSIYCRGRSYHDIEALIWCIIAGLWIYDMFDPKASADKPTRHNPVAFALLAAPLVYPLLSLILGRQWPQMLTPLMPCSLAVFMVGLMLGFRERANLIIVMLVCHWMLLGIAKTATFDLPEDYLLVIATLPAIWIFFSAYIRRASSHGAMKPSPRVMRTLLIVIFILVAGICLMPPY